MNEHVCSNCGFDASTPLKTKPLTNAMNKYVYEGSDPKGKKVEGIYNADAETIIVAGLTLKRKDVKQVDPTKKAEYVLASPNDLGKTAPSGAENLQKQPEAKKVEVTK